LQKDNLIIANISSTTFSKSDIQFVYEALRDRVIHPDGKFDNAGRWYPSEAEDCGVSRVICTPSRAYPYSYMIACRTRKHVAKLAEQSPALFERHLAEACRRAAERKAS
jgi:hypothetical protein